MPTSPENAPSTAVARHGLWTLTAAKFLPGTVVPSLAGALGMSARRFLLFDGFAALFYAVCYLTAGFLFHNQVQQVMVWFDRVCHGVIGLGVVLVVGYVGYKYVLRRRNKRLDRKADLADKGAGAGAGTRRPTIYVCSSGSADMLADHCRTAS